MKKIEIHQDVCSYCKHHLNEHLPLLGFCKIDRCRCPRFVLAKDVYMRGSNVEEQERKEERGN